MDKETLSNYGWIVICVLVLAVMIAMATPFGRFISQAVTNTSDSLFNTQKMNLLEISPQKHSSGIVPKGAQYILSTGEILEPGSKMPNTPEFGDTYIYGDYEYKYVNETVIASQVAQGWNVKVLDNAKESYGAILESINGKPICFLNSTFYRCSNLKTLKGINIPDTVLTMNYTFTECGYLTSIDGLKLSSSLVALNATFHWCYSIKDMHTLKIPSSVKIMTSTFVANLGMTVAPKIPEGVEKMQNTFQYCRNLTQLPEIPSTVNVTHSLFLECTKATGVAKINANPTKLDNMFGNVDFEKQNLILTGDSDILDEMGATGINYCPECNGFCNNNH